MNKRIISVLLAVALVFTILGVAAVTQFPGREEPSPRVIALVPEWSGFVETDEWNFSAVLVSASAEALEARFIGAKVGDSFVPSSVKNEWTKVVRGGREIDGALGRYEELHRSLVRRQAGQVESWWTEMIVQIFEWKYYIIRQQIYTRFAQLREAGEKIDGIVARIPSVPLAVGETVIVELIFEVRNAQNLTRVHQIAVPTSVTKLCPLPVEEPSSFVPLE